LDIVQIQCLERDDEHWIEDHTDESIENKFINKREKETIVLDDVL